MKNKISARRVGEEKKEETASKLSKTRETKKIKPLLERLDSFVGKLYREFSSKFDRAEELSHFAYDQLFPLPGEVDTGGTDEQYLKELVDHMKYLHEFRKKYKKFVSVSEKQLLKFKELEAQLDKLIAEAEQQKG